MRDDRPQPRRINPPVWPLPRSLATTYGISVDVSSSPYLDVSVQAVPRVRLFDSTHADGVLLHRVSPFGDLRIEAYLRLPEAYRSLSRPSSAPDAKAFPLRSYQLDLAARPCWVWPSPNHSWFSKIIIMQASEIFGYIVFTHIPNSFLFRLKFPQFLLLLCCLLFHLELSFTLFSFQGAAPDLC